MRVFDAAIEKAYGGERKVSWMKVYAGEESHTKHGEWLPDETLEADAEVTLRCDTRDEGARRAGMRAVPGARPDRRRPAVVSDGLERLGVMEVRFSPGEPRTRNEEVNAFAP